MRRMTIERLKKLIPRKHHDKLKLTEHDIDWSEGEFGERVFICTQPGYCVEYESLHTITADTIEELRYRVMDIKECHCQDCIRQRNDRIESALNDALLAAGNYATYTERKQWKMAEAALNEQHKAQNKLYDAIGGMDECKFDVED